MKYDDAEIYFLNFETDLPNENGGRHMGLFLEWAIRRGLASVELMQDADALRSGATTGLDLLFDRCDGKLMAQDLGEEGNAFAAAVYEQHHLADFIEAMNLRPDADLDAIFGADLTPQRHRRVLWQLDRRYSDWRRAFGLPDKEALIERLAAIVGPAAEAAGFPRVPDTTWGSVDRRITHERRSDGYVQRLELAAVDHAQWFYGARVELTVHIPGLFQRIYAEKDADIGNVSALQHSAWIPFARLAEGWDGPLEDYGNSPGFWIFRVEEIEPLARWLADRLRSFALPLLRGLDGLEALALEYGRKPFGSSPIHDVRDPYAALLACEMTRHPRLGALLDEIGQAIGAVAPRERTRSQDGALRLIPRIRERAKAWI